MYEIPLWCNLTRLVGLLSRVDVLGHLKLAAGVWVVIFTLRFWPLNMISLSCFECCSHLCICLGPVVNILQYTHVHRPWFVNTPCLFLNMINSSIFCSLPCLFILNTQHCLLSIERKCSRLIYPFIHSLSTQNSHSPAKNSWYMHQKVFLFFFKASR